MSSISNRELYTLNNISGDFSDLYIYRKIGSRFKRLLPNKDLAKIKEHLISGGAPRQICRDFNMSYPSLVELVQIHFPNEIKIMTVEEEIKYIYDLYKSGMSITAISRFISLSRPGILNALSKMEKKHSE